MSVTFTPATHTFPLSWGVSCMATETVVGAVPSYEEALTVRTVHLGACKDCRTYGCFTVATPVGVGEVPTVNVSNVNARHLLALLGLDVEDLCGGLDADAFGSRVLLATANDGDRGTATITYRAEGGATVVDCGRRAGWDTDVLHGLARVAEWAAEHEVEVTWA